MPRKNGRQRQLDLQIRTGTIPFDTPANMQLVLESMQDAGSIPKKYGSWDELKEAYYQRRDRGMKPRQARIDLGIETRVDIFNKRTMREMIPTMIERYITEKYGADTFKQYRKDYVRMFEILAKRDTAYLNRLTDKVWHRGHPESVKHGGPNFDVPAELGDYNIRSRPGDLRDPEAARFPKGVMEDMGWPLDQAQGFYEWKLRNEGVGPRSGSVTKAGAARVTPAFADEGSIKPEQMEMFLSRAQQLEAQGVNMGQAIMDESPTMSTKNAVTQSGAVTDTANNGVIGNGKANGKQAGYTISEWRDWLAKQVPIRELANINNAIRLAASTPAGRAARVVAPAAAGTAIAAISTADAFAREEKYKKDPTLLNRIQRDLGAVEAASDTAGAIPGPQSFVAEPAGLVSGLLNVSIDALRDGTVEKMRQVRGSIRFMP